MYDPDAVRQWLHTLHGAATGLMHVCATGLWTGRTFPADQLDQAADYIGRLDTAGREGIYARVTTLRAPLQRGQRGSAADSAALPALWGDIDIAGPGHADAGKLPPDETTGRKLVPAAGLPEPTLWVHSGGGLYPMWLLDTPHTIADPGDLADLADLAAGWQRAIAHGADSLGWAYGAGVGDLARVLRIPGTINRKAGLARPCRVVDDGGPRYTLAELYGHLAAALPVADAPQHAEPSPRLASVRTGNEATTPGDDYAARVEWGDILGPAGWRHVGQRGHTDHWARPGKDGPGISATTNALGTNRLHVFSTSTPFEAGQSYSKLGAYAVLYHGGDLRAAAKTLHSEGYGTPAPLAPDPTAERAALAELVGGAHTPTLYAVNGTAVRVIDPTPGVDRYGPTEDGLARALVAHHGERLRYCPQRGSWLAWDGHVWRWDDAETHRELIRQLARALPDDDTWRTFKRRALSSTGVSGVARLAQSDPAVVVGAAQLDADPWALNTPAGIVDLRTGETRPADPAGLHTRSTVCGYDIDADPSMWRMFLSVTFGRDGELVAYLQRLVGYSATGTIGPHVLPFAHGSGGNGKGVFLEGVAGVLGDYATTAPVSFLMAQTYASHETEIARLAGARMVLCSEVAEGDHFDEVKVKMLTGGDSLTARYMRQDHFTFTPSHHLWLMGNHRPAVKSGGRAFWRRLRLIPFLHEVPDSAAIDDLQGVLIRDHGPALLAWIVAGAVAYAATGLAEPDSVRVATAEYAAEQDSVGAFVRERCIIGGGQLVKARASMVRAAYEAWCHAEGETPVNPKAFGLAMKNRFAVALVRSNDARWYVGLTVREGPENASPNASPQNDQDHGRYR
jgi:putative DNA primase/helicase